MAVAMLWSMAPVASAGGEWCEGDPLIVIHTPAGRNVPIHVTNYGLGVEHQAAVDSANIETNTVPANGGKATKVTIDVLIRDDASNANFKTRTVASSGLGGTGTVFDTASGRSGKALVLQFTLNVS